MKENGQMRHVSSLLTEHKQSRCVRIVPLVSECNQEPSRCAGALLIYEEWWVSKLVKETGLACECELGEN